MGIFNKTMFEPANDQEFQQFKQSQFLYDDSFKTERTIYKIAFIIVNIFCIASLVLFYRLRNSYIIRQRNFILTFLGGIAIYVNIIIGFIPQICEAPCMLSAISANIINPFVDLIFLTRTLRVVLNYYYNIYKVSSISKNRLNYNDRYSLKRNNWNNKSDSFEPNRYLPKIYKRINMILSLIVIVPMIIVISATIIIYITRDIDCSFTKFEDTLKAMKKGYTDKNNENVSLFYVVIVFSLIYMIVTLALSILLVFVKDANKYGVKFECFSVFILIFIGNFINMPIQKEMGDLKKSDKIPSRIFLKIFDVAKGGKMLFVIVSIYMMFATTTLPVIHYYNSKRRKNRYFQDPMCSIQYFYKVLNNPSLFNELKNIAIKEFSVENILFYENYTKLQKIVYRYELEQKRKNDLESDRTVSPNNFESYYQQQTNNYPYNFSKKENLVDPNKPLPNEILPFYLSFYYMFIDYSGPAVVNISGYTFNNIFKNLQTHPTVGIFDEAKNEVIENMYQSIYPILIIDNKKYIANTIH